MSVMVFPRLSELLRSRNLTVAELERRIEQRFGLSVDPKTLYRLAQAEPVQRADLAIAGAAAVVLGVGLDDLFDVQAVPVAGEADRPADSLSAAQSRRLAELFDRQANGRLSPAEQAEIEALVMAYGQQLHERRLRELAEQRGISVEQARREAAAELDEALGWWQAFEADPARRRALVARLKRRRSAATA